MNTRKALALSTLRERQRVWIIGFGCLLVFATGAKYAISPSAAAAGRIHALFDLSAPETAPFPFDRWTVPDSSQNTGRRVALPLPDCEKQPQPSDCEDLRVINTLDGFNLQPRISIPFDGDINVATVTSETVFLVNLGSTLGVTDGFGRVVGINQVVWDSTTKTLHVESDELLEQHTRYALIVTNGIRDTSGAPVEAAPPFRRFQPLAAVDAARRMGISELEIVVASVFTTQSATAVLEKIRDQIKAKTSQPADFNLGSGGTRTVFPLNQITDMTFNQNMQLDPPRFTPPGPGCLSIEGLEGCSLRNQLASLRRIPGAVGQVGFGKYRSPDYQREPAVIPPISTRTGVPLVKKSNDIVFTVILPSGSPPAGGWPVAIVGHGGNSNKDVFASIVAATLAQHGVATIGINATGHGFGPLSTLTVAQSGGDPVTFPSGGRGIDDDDDDRLITAREGDRAASPYTILWERDALRQTAADLMQLVRTIEVGMDVDGDGTVDIDPARISYLGFSLGANYGIPFVAVDPAISVAAFTVAGGPLIELLRLGPARRPVLGSLLASRLPPLLNAPGVSRLGDASPADSTVAVPAPRFDENRPLRDGATLRVQLDGGTMRDITSPVINSVAGEIKIQTLMENTEWVSQSGNSVAYAPYLQRTTLAGNSPKSVLLQFARGDQTSPNPANTAVIRAGGLQDRTTFYRHDLAVLQDRTVLASLPNPHPFMTSINSGNTLVREIARGAQQQIAVFFASGGGPIAHPEPPGLLEFPIGLPLAEGLNFVR